MQNSEAQRRWTSGPTLRRRGGSLLVSGLISWKEGVCPWLWRAVAPPGVHVLTCCNEVRGEA